MTVEDIVLIIIIFIVVLEGLLSLFGKNSDFDKEREDFYDKHFF
jgi:hypothetical protein